MKVRFYGVRGSIATADEETRRYGGNTSCVAVEAGGEVFVFDAGTGIRKLGCDLGPTNVRAHLFFSHVHWDHIQGFPFFTPAFVPGNELNIYSVKPDAADAPGIRDVLAGQMTAPQFPVGLDVMGADMRFFDVPAGDRIRVGGVQVDHASVDHPNGCVAYRLTHGGHSVVYATDLEHQGDEPAPHLVELANWGHSTFDAGARVAEAAGVKQLVLFHHDPSHNDAFLDSLSERARARRSDTIVAAEGMELHL